MSELETQLREAVLLHLQKNLSEHQMLEDLRKAAPFAVHGIDQTADSSVYGVDLTRLQVGDYKVDNSTAPIYKVREIEWVVCPIRIGDVRTNNRRSNFSNNPSFGISGMVIGIDFTHSFDHHTGKHEFKFLSQDLKISRFRVDRV